MRNIKGFTIVEIMMVLGIILILAVIAIPNMLRARMDSNQMAAITSLKSVINACNLYAMKNQSFPQGELTVLTDESPPYINTRLAQAVTVETEIGGYYYLYDCTEGRNFTIEGKPAIYGLTGRKNFIGDYKGIIHYTDEARSALLDDPEL